MRCFFPDVYLVHDPPKSPVYEQERRQKKPLATWSGKNRSRKKRRGIREERGKKGWGVCSPTNGGGPEGNRVNVMSECIAWMDMWWCEWDTPAGTQLISWALCTLFCPSLQLSNCHILNTHTHGVLQGKGIIVPVTSNRLTRAIGTITLKDLCLTCSVKDLWRYRWIGIGLCVCVCVCVWIGIMRDESTLEVASVLLH